MSDAGNFLRADAERLTAWLPDMIYVGGRFRRGLALVTDERTGRIAGVVRADEHAASRAVSLKDRALLPGMANAHSHAFQRVTRARTEFRTTARDTFWTWREMMYSAASRLTPEDLYDASRMAFLEMALGGATAVGEFHYLHHNTDGTPYDDPNLLAKQVVRAARDVGIRIALLRVAYERSGFQMPVNERQRRFIEADPEIYIRNTEALLDEIAKDGEGTEGSVARAWVGVAPHSVRAVSPQSYLPHISQFVRRRNLIAHMHVGEQPAEIDACRKETGCTPLELLGSEGVLGPHFTAVHVIYFKPYEIQYLKKSGAHVCACPTTERNLGDGTFPADLFFDANVSVALGTDSHAQIDLLEDARELELNLRLSKLSRAVLARAPETNDDQNPDDEPSQLSSLAARLFECATVNGASSIGAESGALAEGRAADFFTVDLNDPSIAGAGEDDLIAAVVFSLTRAAVRETVVGGRLVVEDGRHGAQDEIVARFRALQRKLWS